MPSRSPPFLPASTSLVTSRPLTHLLHKVSPSAGLHVPDVSLLSSARSIQNPQHFPLIISPFPSSTYVALNYHTTCIFSLTALNIFSSISLTLANPPKTKSNLTGSAFCYFFLKPL